MEKLNADAKSFLGDMKFAFSYCKDCNAYKPADLGADHGHCSFNDWDVHETEYCSRSGRKDLY